MLQQCYYSRKFIYGIVILFTLLQFATIFIFKYTPYPDSDGYICLAQECVKAGEFYPISANIDDLPFIWNIGAINLVVLSLWVTGSVLPLMIFYSFLKGFSALLVYLIAKKLFTSSVAFISLCLYVAYPANYGEATSVQSEVPFIFFILLGVYFSLKQYSFIGGVCIAFANWVRPLGIVFLLACAVHALLTYKKRSLGFVFLGYMSMTLTIGTMSYCRTGNFLTQAKTGWMGLLQYSVDHSPYDDGYLTEADGYNAVEKDAVWRDKMLTWVSEHPGEYVRQMPHKFVATYISDNINLCAFLSNKQARGYLYDELSMKTLYKVFPHFSLIQWVTIYNLLYYYTLLLLFLSASFILIRQRSYASLVLPLSIVLFGTGILLLVGHGEARFHLPLMPFIIMLSAVSVKRFALKIIGSKTLLN